MIRVQIPIVFHSSKNPWLFLFPCLEEVTRGLHPPTHPTPPYPHRMQQMAQLHSCMGCYLGLGSPTMKVCAQNAFSHEARGLNLGHFPAYMMRKLSQPPSNSPYFFGTPRKILSSFTPLLNGRFFDILIYFKSSSLNTVAKYPQFTLQKKLGRWGVMISSFRKAFRIHILKLA